CETEMAHDVTIRTSLLEQRLLAGSRSLYDRFRNHIAARIDVRAFFEAKALEQQQRHLRYQDTAYNLEPNVKESPGGLRDLQTIIWIARAAGLGHTWRALASHGLMTVSEAREVARHERLIDDLRIRLHYLADRREDRLVFDVQTALARQLGLEDTPHRRASEPHMLRSLWRNRDRVDAVFRRDPENRARFMAILRQPRGVTHELRRMNQYGILGRYLPVFGRIVGQMQHDLFHVYTVDEHILMVIR